MWQPQHQIGLETDAPTVVQNSGLDKRQTLPLAFCSTGKAVTCIICSRDDSPCNFFGLHVPESIRCLFLLSVKNPGSACPNTQTQLRPTLRFVRITFMNLMVCIVTAFLPFYKLWRKCWRTAFSKFHLDDKAFWRWIKREIRFGAISVLQKESLILLCKQRTVQEDCVWLEFSRFAWIHLELPVTGKIAYNFAWSLPNWGKLCSNAWWDLYLFQITKSLVFVSDLWKQTHIGWVFYSPKFKSCSCLKKR